MEAATTCTIIAIVLCTLAAIITIVASRFIGRDRKVW
jgi:hypothetical protein